MASERFASEGSRTIVFAAVALVLAVGAYATRSTSNVERKEDQDVGNRFFPNLTLEQIKGLEITDFDAKAAKADVFRVDYEKGGWVLPLKENYPADAKDALAKATSWLTSV